MDRYTEIDEVIAYIHQHLDEPLPLSRLANHVAYSQYHFARIFKERIGLPPLYYVSTMRLQKAKDLLLRTKMSVRDIGLEIGQQSLGTFSTRFTERVGISPSEFRESAEQADGSLRTLQLLSEWNHAQQAPVKPMTIAGTIEATKPFQGLILIGLFAKPIPEGLPLYGTLLPSQGDFCFTNVKPGTYYLMATSVAWGTQAMDFLLPYETLRTRSKKPIIVTPNTIVPHQQVTLHEPHPDDPPILISLSLLMSRFIQRLPQ